MRKILISMIVLFTTLVNVYSQENLHSLYFLDEWSQRHTVNAAYAPRYGYFSLPVLGGIQIGINSNLGASSFLFKSTDPTDLRPMLFLNNNVDATTFLNGLDNLNYINQNMSLNLLSFGFYTRRNSFWTFDLYLKERLNTTLPKDLFGLMKTGMSSSSNTYDLKNLSIDQTNYLQATLGYSRDITPKLRIGINAKFLAGISAARIKYSKFDVNLNDDEFSVSTVGEALIMSGISNIPVDADGNFALDQITDNLDINSIIKNTPAGYGFAGDIGITYKPFKHLTIDGAINNIGIMSWKSASIQKGVATGNVSFSGFTNFNNSDSIDKQLDQLATDASSLIQFKKENTSSNFTESLPYDINVSAKYGIFGNDKHDIIVGALWQLYNNPYTETTYNKVVGNVTLKPFSWFSVSGSYDILNPNFNRYGVAISFAPRWINLYIASDYILPKVSKFDSNPLFSAGGIEIPSVYPIEDAQFNLAIGGSFCIGKPKQLKKRTSDIEIIEEKPLAVNLKDLRDKKSKNHKQLVKSLKKSGVKFDKHGYPIDTDKDSIPDFMDKCPGTPIEAIGFVDSIGCFLDSDGDGVYDYLDKCSETPVEARGTIDENGCPKDTDKDGVFDYLDKCPGTPEGIAVDANGCPFDEDGDGVPDYLDLCPKTPVEAKGMVDKNGCPLDSDDDGVLDYQDLCPNTPVEARGFVDKNGCPVDSDDDGVADYLDKCPNTPAEARGAVDEKGCPRDTDGDGVPDYIDNCPKLFGVASNHGCPEVKKEVRTLFQKALQGIQFESGKDLIKKTSNTILNQIAKVLIDNPTYLIEVQGHTDNIGKPDVNLKLSESRANAVRNYLILKGISESRITAKGYGDTKPVLSNKTPQGRAKNRRVEFVVSFEEVKFE
jgi:outer membrane protein OmpA-like peptidoglycan-associated protein